MFTPLLDLFVKNQWLNRSIYVRISAKLFSALRNFSRDVIPPKIKCRWNHSSSSFHSLLVTTLNLGTRKFLESWKFFFFPFLDALKCAYCFFCWNRFTSISLKGTSFYSIMNFVAVKYFSISLFLAVSVQMLAF